MIGFGFFDEAVLIEEKLMMVKALKEKDGSEEPPKSIMPFVEPMRKQLHDIVTKSTKWFFKVLQLSEEFLETKANG